VGGAPPLAGYGARLGGWLLDWIILAVPGAIIGAAIGGFHKTQQLVITNGTVTSQPHFHASAAVEIIYFVIVLAYGTLLVGNPRGQTLGMMAAGTKAIDMTTGAPIGYGRALGRAAFEVLMSVVFFLPWVLDMLWPLWDAKNQTLHDKVTRTVVVKIK
jgi:uncharacterized RDD family membrane protein YckC